MARVLVTGAGGPAGVAVIEHLRAGHHMVVAADAEPDTAGHRMADAGAHLPPGDDPLFGEEVLRLVVDERIDVLVPTVAEELLALHAQAGRLREAGCHVLLPGPEAIALCCDKYAFAQLCTQHGIPVPGTSLPHTPMPPGPWIVKPREGRGSRGVHRADAAAQAGRLAAESPGSIVQTRLTGREFTVDVLCGPDGEVVVQVPRWREQVRGGVSTAGTAFRAPGIEQQVERLVKALGYRGMANVQGCRTEDGTFAFFEMNPRFSGGLPISLAAGADFVEAYIALATGRPVPGELRAWEPGRRVVRYLTQTPGARTPVRQPVPVSTGPEQPSTPAGPRRILVPLGTRPEIVKLAPVVAALNPRHDVQVVFTGQHVSAGLGDAILAEFGMEPAERWDVRTAAAGSGAARLGTLMANAARSLERWRPDAVLVLGDTHTVPAFCLAGVDARVPVVHLEAGLRSYNPLSREEANRRVAAALAALHLAPTGRAAEVLRAEGVPGDRIEVVGNPGLDPLRALGVRAVPAGERQGVLVTAHRPSTVDSPERLAEVVRIVAALVQGAGPVVFPVHPRTADRLRAFGLTDRLAATGAELLGPLPYAELLERMRHSRAVVTDSGGLQEEAAWLRVPTVVMRGSTPRWEGIEDGLARLSPVRRDAVCRAVAEVTAPGPVRRLLDSDCPYGDGRTAGRVAVILGRESTWRRIRLREPDFTDGRVPSVRASAGEGAMAG
ncbi:non-hydrolyzing UDP-N-acetylglucosamine 2-epimerase [Streptomyces sp. NPDC001262]|uniref:non-hydrolyzing UDP-N-acetylglucosamine 2-epimerase n=1 Tax=Streptomyces sp. NPDC001262 TaxID=3364552 RepID=UPI0036BDAB3D